jgi:hypothetical protein
MPTTTWTIEVTEKDLQVLRRKREAMVTLVREEQLPPDLVDDFHQCIETLEAMLGRVRPAGER